MLIISEAKEEGIAQTEAPESIKICVKIPLIKPLTTTKLRKLLAEVVVDKVHTLSSDASFPNTKKHLSKHMTESES